MAAAGPEALEGADLVVIGAPPIETAGLVASLGGPLRTSLAEDAVVTDGASTKSSIVAAANGAGLQFVVAPMAGREVAGYANSAADLFAGRPWVLVRGAAADDAALERVTWVATACGARPLPMAAGAHDAAVAGISHLPLVVAAALAEAVAGAAAERPGWPAAPRSPPPAGAT
jgi:prephenate dehydrogenase